MASREIILYHYPTSPYARRVIWYLNLRRIPYSECIQPLIMPRPDIKALGISYRRIPILTIGRDVYHDTRLIIAKLNAFYPPSASHPPLAVSTPEHLAFADLFSSFATDGGLFAKASLLIPTAFPLFKDPKFTSDRSQMSGRPWTTTFLDGARPEALVEIRRVMVFLETSLLADGRNWILNTPQLTIVDLEAVWPLHWLIRMPGAIPPEVASKESFPKVFAWVARFNAAVSEARKKNKQPQALKGFEAAQRIWEAGFAEPLGEVDAKDPVRLSKGQEVLVHPTDSGVQHKDRGTLLALNGEEIVIEVVTDKGTVRVHAPRHGFRVVPVNDEPKL